MKKIIAIPGSNSKDSINKKLIKYTTSMLPDMDVQIMDLNEFDIPMYGIDHENEHGFPDAAQNIYDKIQASDGILLSLAEHNGAYTAIFKNMMDWLSRINKNIWGNKPMLLMATSPGARGGRFVLDMAESRMPILGAHIVEVFSLPSFYDNFSDGQISNLDYNKQLTEAVSKFKNAV